MRARLFPLAYALCLALIAAACTGSSTSIDVTAPTSLKCQVTAANGMTGTAPATGTSSTIEVNTTRDCTWSAASEVAWIAIMSSATGQGSGSISYRVNPNAEPVQRRGVVDVNNSQVAVVQEPAPCRFAVAPSSA